MSVTSVPSLSLPGSVVEPSVSSSAIPPNEPTHDPQEPTNKRKETSMDDDLYSVPENDTADYVGIGSLAHIIRKCFKEIYYPEADLATQSSLTDPSIASSGSPAPSFVELPPEELEKMDEEQVRAEKKSLRDIHARF